MKTARKLLTLALALALTLALGAAAAASSPPAANNGSIIVDGVTPGDTYDIYRVFDMTMNAATGSVAYTIAPNWETFFNAGIGNKYIVADNPNDAANQKLNPIVVGNVLKRINITETNKLDFARDALNYAGVRTADYSKVPGAGETNITFANLPLGYYMMYPQGATDIKPEWGSIVSLNSTVPSVTILVKAEPPTIDKTTTGNLKEINAQVGQAVPFTITGKVPETSGFAKYIYRISDTMTPGLTFNAGVSKMKVMFGTTEITPSTTELKYANNGFVLDFDMTKYQQYKGQPLTVTYEAVVNKNAVSVLTKNEAKLNYSHDPQNAESTRVIPPPPVIVYTGKVVIEKHDDVVVAATGKTTPLAGAQFVLKEGAKFYKYDESADKVSWVDTQNEATVKTTLADGKAEFIGLKDGTYQLVEIKAPDGYNRLVDPISVTVSTTANSEGKKIGQAKIADVENKAGTILPSTGGIGTTIFYVLGSCLLVGAVVLLVSRKRMRSQEQ